MKQRVRQWVVKRWRAARRRWRRLRGWRPDVRGWPWRARWLAHEAAGRWVGWSLLAIGVIMVGAVVAVVLKDPEWLTGEGLRKETGSTTIRNAGLVGGGAIAILIAYWRSRLAQQDLLNKRYQEGAAMLGSGVLSVRLAGIYALERLAKDHPWEYHVEIMKLLSAFVCNPTENAGSDSGNLGQDLEAAIEAISACHERQRDLERGAEFQLDLSNANFEGAFLRSVNVSGARLVGVNLVGAGVISWDLCDADLSGAYMTDTRLRQTDLKDADLLFVNVTGADFTGTSVLEGIPEPLRSRVIVENPEVTGLTQDQLDSARADPEKPPNLEGVRDAKTGKKLVWRGRTLDLKPHPNPPPIPDD